MENLIEDNLIEDNFFLDARQANGTSLYFSTEEDVIYKNGKAFLKNLKLKEYSFKKDKNINSYEVAEVKQKHIPLPKNKPTSFTMGNHWSTFSTVHYYHRETTVTTKCGKTFNWENKFLPD